MIAVKNGIVFDESRSFKRNNVIIHENKIAEIGEISPSSDLKTIDAAGCYVVPGFIDIHTHGADGCDVMSSSFEQLDRMSLFYASQGVTAFLPTTMTAPIVKIVKAIESIKLAIEKGTRGAKILGINLEGPFINKKFKGSHPEEYIMYPNLELIESFIRISGNNIKMITIAPELEGANDIALKFGHNGIVFAIGHSALNSGSAREVFKYGITHITHIFNAMVGIHHREPGLAGAALDCDNVTVEVIADGIHINPSIVRMVVKCKSPENVAFVTDSTMAAGLEDGEYTLGEQQIVVSNGESRLKNGVLSGSTLTMINALRNAVNMFGIPIEQALTMVSDTPSRIVGVSHSKGSIAVGKDADLVLLDKDLNVRMTIVEGKVVYNKD